MAPRILGSNVGNPRSVVAVEFAAGKRIIAVFSLLTLLLALSIIAAGVLG